MLLHLAKRLRFDELLGTYVPGHGNEKIPSAQSLLLLVLNITSGRLPLYELLQWTTDLDGRLIGRESELSPALFNDDRYARALDKLYQADRASLMTDLVLAMVKALQLDLSQLHNDSTSIKTCGQMPGKTSSGMQFLRGHSKDHRPDLKQIVFSLSLTADGAVPIHFKAYSGNRTDDTTHIQTWKQLRELACVADFLYVADCKVCTDSQLSFITEQGGRVVSLMPDTWAEAKAFKQSLRESKKTKRKILQQPVPNRAGKLETFYLFTGSNKTSKRGYTLHWIYSTDETLSAKAALLAYKYQPRLEKRFEQLKTVHNGATTLCKKVERVEAMMFLFFLALVLQVVLEREVRHAMIEQTINSIPVYLEHGLSAHPTTARIFD